VFNSSSSFLYKQRFIQIVDPFADKPPCLSDLSRQATVSKMLHDLRNVSLEFHLPFFIWGREEGTGGVEGSHHLANGVVFYLRQHGPLHLLSILNTKVQSSKLLWYIFLFHYFMIVLFIISFNNIPMEEGGKTVKNKKCFFCLKNVRGISTFSLSSTCPGEKLRARGIGRLDFSDRKMGIDPRQKKISKVFIDLRERIAVFFCWEDIAMKNIIQRKIDVLENIRLKGKQDNDDDYNLIFSITG